MNTRNKLAFVAILSSSLMLHAERIEEQREYTFDLSSPHAIALKVEDSNIKVEGTNEDSIYVEIERSVDARSKAKGHAILEQLGSKIAEHANKLEIESPLTAMKNPHKKAHFRETITIRTPYQTELSIKTEDGNVVLKKLSGDIKIKAEDGNVACHDFSGFLEAKLEDGNLKGKRFSGTITAKLEDGDAYLHFVDTPEESCYLKAGDGNISLDLDKDCHVRLEMKTKDGNIDSNYETILTKTDETKEPHKNVSISLKTEDGNITIN
ncbi:DUF4097 domain-containing protein [Puniceicoccaceae bacterium K14]|nr:DUF4097 domain-containing protein [Puniceicoccaceae bacterium K14]